MQALELKIPPPIVTLLVAAAMWGISLATMRFEFDLFFRSALALAVAVAGLAVLVSGALAFRRGKTTTNPLKPEAASALVTYGVFRVTRNPMYVGLCVVLLGWALFLASPLALLGPVVFVLYISRFQIAPEERILSRLFGSDYTNYQSRVRRWL
jgi:protein-S-isoprenylcysteine O-methyltransferase Ste14